MKIELQYRYLTLNDRMPFGKFKGVEVGMVYMFEPDYLDWLFVNTDIVLVDIEEAKSLKVITSKNSLNWLIHTGIIGKEIYEFEFSVFTFRDIKYNGFEIYNFSKTALEANEKKLNPNKKIQFIDNKPLDIVYFTILFLSHEKGKIKYPYKNPYKYIGSGHTGKSEFYEIFEYDNTNNCFDKLPKIKNCRVGLFGKASDLILNKSYKLKIEENMFIFEDV